MSKIVSLAVFIIGGVAGAFIGKNADVIKEQLSVLFVPPKPDNEEEEIEDECTCYLKRPEVQS